MATKKKPSWHQPSWPAKQRARLEKLLRDQAKDPATTWLGYWNSDAWGRSANGGGHEIAPAAAGVVHRLPGKDLDGDLGELMRHGKAWAPPWNGSP